MTVDQIERAYASLMAKSAAQTRMALARRDAAFAVRDCRVSASMVQRITDDLSKHSWSTNREIAQRIERSEPLVSKTLAHMRKEGAVEFKPATAPLYRLKGAEQ